MKYALTHANIYLDPGRFAEALLVEDGLIRAVGTDQEIELSLQMKRSTARDIR